MLFLLLIPLLFIPTILVTSAKNNNVLTDIVSIIAKEKEQNSVKNPIDFHRDDIFLIEAEPSDRLPIEVEAELNGFRILKRLHSFPNIFVAERIRRRKRSSASYQKNIQQKSKIRWSEHVRPLVREKRNLYLKNSNESKTVNVVKKMHMNGHSGKGVVVAILDDGVDYTHPALYTAYRQDLSFDFTNDKFDALPEDDEDNHHGTNCAGIIAMSPSSSCGIGVAFKSQIAGLKMLGGVSSVNDIMEGEALAHKLSEIDIYSVSWGPKDDGSSMDGPHRLARMALAKGAKTGRSGLGSIYVWASGNGGLQQDDCSMDGYVSNRYTLTFGIADTEGNPTWYAEGCPAVMASVVAGTHKGLPTTDIGGTCTYFTGSSAAAPLASGILALVLETNPALSQRDIQHLIVRTSNSKDLVMKNPQFWQKNAAGFSVSRLFGFGLLDAEEMISKAKKWKTVERETVCSRELFFKNLTFSLDTPAVIEIPFSGCISTSSEVNFIERIELQTSIHHPRRGSVVIDLESPSGTRIRLLQHRPNDDSPVGILNWPFISSHFWGEKPQGTWKLHLSEKATSASEGTILHLNLLITGTQNEVMN